MQKILVFLICLGPLVSGITQAQVLNTSDQLQVMGAEDANPPTFQLPSNPPSGGGGNAQGGTNIQGPGVAPTVNLTPPAPTLAPTLVPTKAQVPQDRSIKKGTAKLDTKKLEGESGLRAGGPKIGVEGGLNIPSSKGSLLGGGVGSSPGFPSGSSTLNTFGRPAKVQPSSATATGFAANPGVRGGRRNPGLSGPTAARTKTQNRPKLPGQPTFGAGGTPGKKKSLGFGSSLAKIGSLPPLELDTDEDETTGTTVGNTNDVTPAKDGTDPTTGLPPLIVDDYVGTGSVTSTDPKDKQDVEALKGIFSNTGNPNDPGDGSVEIDQEKISAAKKAIQKRKCAGSDTRTTGTEGCTDEVPTEVETQQRVCKKRSEIGGKCEQWGPAPTGPVVDYNRAQPDNIRPK
ncbi:MAG TPA: hypothetical protein ENI80_07045 [Acidiferrobacteraceae bacterium]|nr:hypothetical protein [Acidiferrobacteraceae bacterium]